MTTTPAPTDPPRGVFFRSADMDIHCQVEGGVRSPMLILPGQHDLSAPLDHRGVMARTTPTCEVRVTLQARHSHFIGEPEILPAAVREFRQSYGLRGGARQEQRSLPRLSTQ